MRVRIGLAGLVAVLAGGSLCAECTSGGRAVSEQEVGFLLSTRLALKQAIPPNPVGWRLWDQDPVAVPGVVCTSIDRTPFYVAHSVEYSWEEGARQANRLLEEVALRASRLRDLPPTELAEIADLARKARELRGRAAVSMDPAAGASLSVQAATLEQQITALRNRHRQRIEPEISALVRGSDAVQATKKTEVRLTVLANERRTELSGPVESLKIPGASVALRSGNTTVLYFGPVAVKRLRTTTTIWSAFDGSQPPTTVRTVTLRFRGEPVQVDELLAGLRVEPLLALAGAGKAPALELSASAKAARRTKQPL